MRAASVGIRTYRADYDGALTFVFAPGTPHVPRAEREHDRHYGRDAPMRDASAVA